MMTPKRLTVELDRRLDGPHHDEHTAAAADLAAECVRFLNYATGSHAPAGLVYPCTIYAVAADLSLAADRMPQLFDQLSRWLAAEDAAGHLGRDDQPDQRHRGRRRRAARLRRHAGKPAWRRTRGRPVGSERTERARPEPRGAGGMTAKLAAIVAALSVAIDAAARVRVALWPGWVVPLPTLIVAALALLALVLTARLALTLIAGRGVLPYIAVAVTWRGVGR